MDLAHTDALDAKLSALEAAETPITAPLREQVDEPPQPAEPITDGKETPISNPPDTRPAADKPAERQDNKPKETTSAFSKDQQRKDQSWKSLNSEKEAFRKQQQDFALERAKYQQNIDRDQQAKAKSSSKNGPEFYEQGASALLQAADASDLQADGLEARAQRLEDNGDEAGATKIKAQVKALRNQAIVNRSKSEEAKNYADHLRKNPDPTLQQIQEKNASALKFYTLEAAKIPGCEDMVKEGSEFLQKMAVYEKNLEEQGYPVIENPVMRYHVAQFIRAESAAGRVPAMEKELGQLRAKVKELEAFTAPGGGRSAVTQQLPPGNAPRSDEDEGAALRAEAQGRRTLI